MPDTEINFTYSAVVPKDGKPYISVMFERDKDCAEGAVPACQITKNKGFTDQEVEQLEQYLGEHKKEIIENAKKISGFRHWYGIEREEGK